MGKGMNCRTISVADLDVVECLYLVQHLTREYSDFSLKLRVWASGVRPKRSDGYISIVEDHGEIVGWVRSEVWWEQAGEVAWDTLEAFVAPSWRGRSIASWAAAGLACGPLSDVMSVAVFAPTMMLLAKRVGLHPVLFEQDDTGRWVRA